MKSSESPRKNSRKKFVVCFLFVTLAAVFISAFTLAEGGLSCKARNTGGGACPSPETSLFSIYDFTNSHVGSPEYFSNQICCNQTKHSNNTLTSTIKDNTTGGAVCKDNQEKSILSFYQQDDSHVEQTSLDNYKNETCVFPYTNCSLRNTSLPSENCSAYGEECVVSLAKNDSNSHVEACNETNYNYSLCCDVPEPDLDQKICEGNGYYWNSSWVEYDQGNSSCCGDDQSGGFSEVKRTKECAVGVCSDNATDWACCDQSSDCVHSSKCYNNCEIEDVNQDGYNETCYEGEWKLGKERGKIVVTGNAIGWKTAEAVPDAYVIVKLIHEGDTLDTETGQTNSQGDFRLAVKAPMSRGESYLIRVTTQKGGERSYVEKDFIYHGGVPEYVKVCG